MAEFSDLSPRVERVVAPILFTEEQKRGGVDVHAADRAAREGYSQRMAAKEAGYVRLQRELLQESLLGRVILWWEDSLAKLNWLLRPYDKI